jgi:N-acetylglucosaminyldiphosphoundecaprenol N-acetyl-beta-D-mannosaminyltransferase
VLVAQPIATPLRQVQIGDLWVHDVLPSEVVSLVEDMVEDRRGGYICTPNVDHVVQAHRNPGFREAVAGATLRVPDGMWIVFGSRLAGRPLRGTVTGRLLPEAIGQRLAGRNRSIALFGAAPGVAERAADHLRRQGIAVADAFAPPLGFALDSDADREALRRLAATDAAVIFVGLGAPKQELWMGRHMRDLPGRVLVGVGSAIDVLAGEVPEAPRWMTRIGAEWLFRLAHEPRRLARRYLVDDPRFLWWMMRARTLRARGSGSR